MPERQYVFGYGSLLELCREFAGTPRTCELSGLRRTWNIAMDNGQTIPGYKHYVDAATGERRRWFVTFLNLVPEPGARVNGVLLEADEGLLAQLDRRERNYERIEASRHLANAVDGPVWTYVGSPAAFRRYELGRLTSRAVISREYYERVCRDFATVGEDQLQRFTELTAPFPCPVLDLRRIDHPPEPASDGRSAESC